MWNTNRAYILARRVVQQMLADRRTLALITVVPVILMSFMGILIRSNESDLRVGVVTDDQGFTLGDMDVNLGQRLIDVLGGFEEFDTEVMTAARARDQLDDGNVDAVIMLAADFTAQVVQTRELNLAVEFEGSNPMVAEQLRNLLERVALQVANTLALTGSQSPAMPVTPPGGAMPEFTTTLDAAYLHSGPEYDTLDYMAPALIGFFVFFFVFLLTCISFLRERVVGTLERLQATPIRPLEIIMGYMAGFLVFGLFQGVVTLLFTIFVLDIHYAGNLANIFVVETLLVALSVNLGILLSTFAQNEFQVLQFIPLIVVTQGVLGGVVWQVDNMPGWLQPFARLMPLTYANEALREVMIKGASLPDVAGEIGVVLLFVVLVIAFSARTAGRAKI
jgi:ABC-2 type transport system permease protein